MKRHASAAFVAAIGFGSVSCGDDVTGPDVTGEYSLVEVDGSELPYLLDSPECDLTFRAGTLSIFARREGEPDARWDMQTDVPYVCPGGQTGQWIRWTGSGTWQIEGDTLYLRPADSDGRIPLVIRGDSLHRPEAALEISMTWVR